MILTTCHVVASNFDETDPNISLEFYKDIIIKTKTDIKLFRAAVIPDFVDRSNDLAIVATLEAVNVEKAIRYTRTDKINPGEKVAALGYPIKGKFSQTVGRVTGLEAKYLIFDAKIAPGSSGGPLIDGHGRMIGVSTLISGENEGYAVNMNLVLAVVENWLKVVKLKEKWEYQKYATGFEKTIKSWPFLTGTGIVLAGGGVLASGVLKKDSVTPLDEFPKPAGRPSGN